MRNVKDIENELEQVRAAIPYYRIEELERELAEARAVEYEGRYYKTKKPDEIVYYQVLPNRDPESWWYLRSNGFSINRIVLPEHLQEITKAEFMIAFAEFEEKISQ